MYSRLPTQMQKAALIVSTTDVAHGGQHNHWSFQAKCPKEDSRLAGAEGATQKRNVVEACLAKIDGF